MQEEYISKIKNMSDNEILEEFKKIYSTMESHFLGLERIGELMQKYSLFQRIASKEYKNLVELGTKVVELCNEYQNKYNHLIFEIKEVRSRDTEYLKKKIKEKNKENLYNLKNI